MGLYINDIFFATDELRSGADGYSALYHQADGNEFLQKLAFFYQDFLDKNQTLEVKTSGSTGDPKQISIKKEYMLNSARATLAYLNLKPCSSALLCMPLDYIAGKMMALRALAGELKLYTISPCRDPFSAIKEPYAFDFIAITTMQAACIKDNEESKKRLLKCKNTIIGGGPLNSAVISALKYSPNPVYQSYAMTETLSHIALLDIRKDQDVYTLLDNITLSLSDRGTAVIHAPHLCECDILTNDIVELIDNRHFKVTGRIDNVINSGGIKIMTEELEKALEGFTDRAYAISSVSDSVLGQAVTLVIEGLQSDFKDREKLDRKIETLLRYHRPKHIVFVDKIPMTPTFKVKRKELADMLDKMTLEQKL